VEVGEEVWREMVGVDVGMGVAVQAIESAKNMIEITSTFMIKPYAKGTLRSVVQ
jgi:hypothetical protein